MNLSEMEIDDETENMGTGDKELDAIMAKLKEPIKNPAPRGKKIIDPVQARYMHRRSTISVHGSDSTFNDSTNLEQSKSSVPPTPNRIKLAPGQTMRDYYKQLMLERQQQFHKQEMALGGYHNIFKDPCPDFKRQNDGDKSVTSESETEQDSATEPANEDLDATIAADEDNVAISSQGRAGRGCSTPNMVNNTFASLRTIDVSAVVCTENVRVVETPISRQKTPVVQQPAKPTSSKNVPAAAQPSKAVNGNTSMDDVISKLQKTPKRSMPARKSVMTVTKKSLDVAIEEEPMEISAEMSRRDATYTVHGEANATYSVHKEGTFTIENNDGGAEKSAETSVNASTVKHGTFTISRGNIEIPGSNNATISDTAKNNTYEVRKDQTYNINEENLKDRSRCKFDSKNNADPIFAVPAVPNRSLLKSGKTTVEQREDRMNTSRKKNASILEVMGVDVPSPGRALFAARPLKKQKPLVKTPARSKPSVDDDTMEVSIELENISQQPSFESSNTSETADPKSDPRPPQATPTRAPGFTRSRRNTPNVSLSTSAVTPSNNSASAAPPNSLANMSPKSRSDAIRRSVERLSRPRSHVPCHRTMRQEPQPPPIQLSPFVGTQRGVNVTLPVTPSQPIDTSRMLATNADRSGTVRRVAGRPRTLLSRTVLSNNELDSTHVRKNLTKRPGYKVGGDSITSAVSEPVRATPLNRTTLSARLEPAGDAAPASAEASHLDSATVLGEPSTTAGHVSVQETLADEEEETLLRAARHLSLEDVSPGEGDVEPSMVAATSTNEARYSGKLLPDSICSIDTPHKAAPPAFKRPFSPTFEDTDTIIGADTVLQPRNDSVSSADEESLVVIKPRKRVDAMILKPREVLHPSPPPDPNVRRSSRNRMKPVRQWLGEKPVYAVSPGGSRTLKGVTEVVIKEKRWLKVRTANSAVAVERERAWAAHQQLLREKRRQEARERKEQRIRELHNRHRRGVDLNVTVDSIVTSSDEEDYD
ncbi:hypothetical protein Q1695_007643 [Nippostrongylus brasiliensis]|nr:hypothetical protein Q1695_007643 [Nippostrongylus brasiliensis]